MVILVSHLIAEAAMVTKQSFSKNFMIDVFKKLKKKKQQKKNLKKIRVGW